VANTLNELAQLIPEFSIKEHARIEDYRDEAEDIAQLYYKTYNIKPGDTLTQLSYPYPEALDPIWIDATARDRDTIWKVVTDTRNGHVIGSGTVQLNREHQRAYVRGVMIDPAYQKYGVGGYILVNAFQKIIADHRDAIKLFWSESRTAHSGSQKIAEAAGMRPVGLLPNKDYFLEKRESDLLLILYAMNALKRRRNEPQLISEVLPLYNVIAQQFRLDPVVPVQVSPTPSNGYQVKGVITHDVYQYCYCTYTAYGKELKFLINPRTQVAEKTWFSPDIDPVTLKTLLRVALDSLSPWLFYMECYISAFQPQLQRVFADLGFTPTGYLPGWDLVDGQREDSILFSRVQDHPAWEALQLTPRAEKIAGVVLGQLAIGKKYLNCLRQMGKL